VRPCAPAHAIPNSPTPAYLPEILQLLRGRRDTLAVLPTIGIYPFPPRFSATVILAVLSSVRSTRRGFALSASRSVVRFRGKWVWPRLPARDVAAFGYFLRRYRSTTYPPAPPEAAPITAPLRPPVIAPITAPSTAPPPIMAAEARRDGRSTVGF
jgi:hypothetical protein